MSAGRARAGARASAGARSPLRRGVSAPGGPAPPASPCRRVSVTASALLVPCLFRRFYKALSPRVCVSGGHDSSLLAPGVRVLGHRCLSLPCPLPSRREPFSAGRWLGLGPAPPPGPRVWCWRSGLRNRAGSRSPVLSVAPPAATSPRPGLERRVVRSCCSSGRCAPGGAVLVTSPKLAGR